VNPRFATDGSGHRRIAHFLLVPELSHSPPNEALINAYQELGYSVDVYSPGDLDLTNYGPGISGRKVEYGRRWLLRNVFTPEWRQYDAFSGTSEDPIGVVGVLSAFHGRPAIALADEIKSEGYSGDRSYNWKRLCRFGMKRAKLTIVNDHTRIDLQRSYAGLSEQHRVIVYPGGYREPPMPVNRVQQRGAWGIPEDAIVIGASGGFNMSAGADWLIEALESLPDVYAVLQPLGVGALSRYLLQHLAVQKRLYVEHQRLGWKEAWAQAAAFDIGTAIYRNPAPQFQCMGTSSNRLCMLLAMGVPVIASRQDSFRFLDQYDCGVLVDDTNGFSAAVAQIRSRLPEMKANARRCWREYVATQQRYGELIVALRQVLAS
jgi:glycosyltransferase involved in cell wall biosynthesis